VDLSLDETNDGESTCQGFEAEILSDGVGERLQQTFIISGTEDTLDAVAGIRVKVRSGL
jgi:hypothetical protein